MIQVDRLTKIYGNKTAVSDLSFTVHPGKITAFLGPNGAGKSTTIEIMLGLCQPDKGAATFDGVEYHNLKLPLTKVGASLEAVLPHRDLTAEKHLKWMATSCDINKKRVHEVLKEVGLSDAARLKVSKFSLGMNQRLGLAAALLGDPHILVLDEPTNGLDPEAIRWLRDLLRKLASESRTILVSSHLLSEVAQVADHLIVIKNGELLADTSTPEFLKAHARESIRVLMKESDILSFQQKLIETGFHVTKVTGTRLEINSTTANEIKEKATIWDYELDEIYTQKASLEDAFFNLLEETTK